MEGDDWDRQLQEIDAAFQSATKRCHNTQDVVSAGSGDESLRKSRRRLTESLFVSHQQNEASNSSLSSFLSPCTRSQTRSSYSYRSSHQVKIVMQHSQMTFKGRVIYSRTTKEVEKSAVELFNFVEEKKRKEGHVALGFDIEWKPTFRKGVAPGKAAVMQICGDKDICYVLHIIHSGIPQTLQFLLEDPTVVKLPKPSKIRSGNWEANVLSSDQLHYAATDAFVSWYLHQALKSLPDIVDNEK